MGDGFRPAPAHPLNRDEEADERSWLGCREEKWVSLSFTAPKVTLSFLTGNSLDETVTVGTLLAKQSGPEANATAKFRGQIDVYLATGNQGAN